MDLINLNDGLYSLVPVTKALLADVKLFNDVKNREYVKKITF